MPGFIAGAVPDNLSVINGIRLALAPALVSAAALCWLARSAAQRGAGVSAAVPPNADRNMQPMWRVSSVGGD
jgi:H+/Cl- antiporter ClcA